MAREGESPIGEALGMIETRGLVAMIEAADAMVKAESKSRGLGKNWIGLCDRPCSRGRRSREGCYRCGSRSSPARR